MEFKYNTTFANIQIKPVVSEEKDKYLSLASIANLKKFLPDVDTSKNIDLLPIAFDACVVNRVNKNGDVINSATAAEMVKNFINKPINIEHDRSRVVGCILTANFSKFGNNESLAELDVKDMKEPFYITLGGVMWKIINPQLANLIEESNDPSSENYMKVSASWELGFSDYEENNTSQDDKINVKKERIYMKITKIEDITDTLLKEVTASSITEFIGEEIKKLNDQFAAEKAEKENALKAATEKSETALAEQENLKKQLAEVSEKLSAIEAQQLAKAQEEAFNMRMADLDNEYDLSDEDRKVLASDIKDLNEEGFSAYKGKMAVLMKEKNKAAKKAQMKKEEEMKAAVASQEVKASEEVAQTISTTQEVVEQAVDNGSKASTEIPNSAPATEQTVREKYASAFGLEGFSITNK
jgi:hypothetical protein